MSQNPRTLVLQAPLFSASGYGSYARDVFRSMLLCTPYRIVGVNTMWGHSSEPIWGDSDFSKALQIACKSRPDKGEKGVIFMQLALSRDFTPYSGCVNIGVTLGLESDSVPEQWIEGANLMDALIVNTTFTKEQYERGGLTIPCYVVGEGVDINIFHPVGTRPQLCGLDMDTSFNFITGGQWWGNAPDAIDRKAVGETIKIFCDAFRGSKEVGLIVKSHTYNNSTADEFLTAKKINLLKGHQEFPRVYLVHGRMTDAELALLYNDNRVKAFVSPTHGEGWGRMLAEAVACDLPLIVGGWGGHMDFIDPSLASVLTYEMGLVPESVYSLYDPTMKWAYADPVEVKRFMLRCYKKYDGAVKRAVHLGAAFRVRFSEEVTRRELANIVMHISEADHVEEQG